MYVNRTPTLGLPQYEGSDKLQRVDMNAAYAVMDAAIAARPAADEQGKYPAARLADQAESAAALGGVSAETVINANTVVNWYVSVSGNDASGNGSADTPWRTVQYAVSQIKSYHAEATINILSGQYDECVTLNRISCKVNLLGSSTGHPVLTGIKIQECTNVKVENIDIRIPTDSSDITNGVLLSRSFATLSALKITGRSGFNGIMADNASLWISYTEVNGCDKAVYLYSNTSATIVGLTGENNTESVNVRLSWASIVSVHEGQVGPIVKGWGGIIWKGGNIEGDTIENPPLSSGWSYSPAFANEKSYICRHGNIVSGLMAIKTSADYSAWGNILIIPEGYHPKARCAVRACIGNESACTLFFYASGSVQCSVPIKANTAMQITFSYIGG